MSFDPRQRSRVILDGPDRAAARSMLRAIGFTDEDLAKPLVGVAHCWIEITPCCTSPGRCRAPAWDAASR